MRTGTGSAASVTVVTHIVLATAVFRGVLSTFSGVFTEIAVLGDFAELGGPLLLLLGGFVADRETVGFEAAGSPIAHLGGGIEFGAAVNFGMGMSLNVAVAMVVVEALFGQDPGGLVTPTAGVGDAGIGMHGCKHRSSLSAGPPETWRFLLQTPRAD